MSSEELIIKNLQSQNRRLREEVEEVKQMLELKEKQLSVQKGMCESLENRNKNQKIKTQALEQQIKELRLQSETKGHSVPSATSVAVSESSIIRELEGRIHELEQLNKSLSEECTQSKLKQDQFLKRGHQVQEAQTREIEAIKPGLGATAQQGQGEGEGPRQLCYTQSVNISDSMLGDSFAIQAGKESICEVPRAADALEYADSCLPDTLQENSAIFSKTLEASSLIIKADQQRFNQVDQQPQKDEKPEPEARAFDKRVNARVFESQDLELVEPRPGTHRKMIESLKQYFDSLLPNRKLPFVQMLSLWSEVKLDSLSQSLDDLK